MAITIPFKANVNASGNSIASTAPSNTTGVQRFYIAVHYGFWAAEAAPTGISDNFSNEYTLVQLSSDGPENALDSRVEWWKCDSPIVGNNHTISVHFPAGTSATIQAFGIAGAAELVSYGVAECQGQPWGANIVAPDNSLILFSLTTGTGGGDFENTNFQETSTPPWTIEAIENDSGTNWGGITISKAIATEGTYRPAISNALTAYAAVAAWLVVGVATVATLSSPTATSITNSAATLGATTDQGTAGSNNAYAVWSTSNGFSGVTATQVKAGQNAAGSTSGVSNSGAVAITTTSPTIPLTGLSASTTYYYAIVQNNANGDSNVLTGSFTTSATLRSTSVNFRDSSNAAVASTSIAWFLTSSWGGSVLESGTTSTNGSGALLLSSLTSAAGAYKLFYKLASDENLNGMRPVTLV